MKSFICSLFYIELIQIDRTLFECSMRSCNEIRDKNIERQAKQSKKKKEKRRK